MDERFDRTLQQLKAEAPDPRLAQLEPRVWARIDAVRDGRYVPFLPMRAAAAVAVALVFGVAVGGFGANEARAERQEVAVFSVEARLAPSTLLDGL